jgi:hypothetical protein
MDKIEVALSSLFRRELVLELEMSRDRTRRFRAQVRTKVGGQGGEADVASVPRVALVVEPNPGEPDAVSRCHRLCIDVRNCCLHGLGHKNVIGRQSRKVSPFWYYYVFYHFYQMVSLLFWKLCCELPQSLSQFVLSCARLLIGLFTLLIKD